MLTLPGAEPDSAPIEKKQRILDGKRHFCVDKSGVWQLRGLNSDCFKLEKDVFEIDTKGPVHISLNPVAYRL